MAEELKEREAFELQAAMRGLDISMFTPPSEKEYRNPDTQAEWQGWKARAQLPSQGGETVEVVAWQDAENPLYTTAERRVMHDWAGNGYPIVELMTVAQHQRILAATTHPAEQVAEPDADLVRQCIAQELATWEGDFKGPVHTAMRCLQVRIDAKMASLEVKP